MKVILLKDVKELGKAGTMLDVSDGYSRNYLIPRKLAVEATPKNIAAWEKRREQETILAAETLAEAHALKEKIRDVEVTFVVKAGEGGRLFGSVTSKDLEEALAEKSIKVDRRKIMLDEPLREVGDHEVGIKLHKEVSAVIKVKIVSE